MYKHGRYKIIIAIMFILGDIIMLNLLYFSILYASKVIYNDVNNVYHLICIFINLGYLLSFVIISVDYDDIQQLQLIHLFEHNFYKLTVTAFILLSSLFFLKIAEPTSRLFIITFFSAATILMTISQWLIRKALDFSIRHRFNKGVILGTGQLGEKIFNEMLNNIYNGVIILGFFDDNPDENCQDLSGNIEEAKDFILKNGITDVFCTLPRTVEDKITDFIKFSEKHMLNFHIVPDVGYYHSDSQPVVTPIGKMPVFLLRHVPLSYAHNALIKMSFDFFVSLMAIIIIFPVLFPILAILIKLSSPGPVIFKQQRTGKRGEDFTCYKFRTMRVSSDANTKQATINDERKTKIGDFLRKTSLDELPQLFNVLKGDMSLIGPRPHMTKHTYEYSPQVDKYMVRHFIKPGITGLAQVRGYRGETKDVELMDKRIKSDVEYVENWSLGMDLKIMFQTILLIVKGDDKAF